MASFKIKKLILKDKKTGTQVVGEIEVEGGKPITKVEELPAANEENFAQDKIYYHNDDLTFLSKKASATPSTQSYTITISERNYGCALVGDYIYIFGGVRSSYQRNTIYKLNITTREVQQLTTTLPANRVKPRAVAVGTNIYIFGGDNNSGTAYSTIYKFDTTTETISTLSTTLVGARMGIGTVVYGNIIYLFGGYYPSVSSEIYKFDTTTESMTKVSVNLPKASYNIPLTLTNGLIYLFGGRDSSTTSVYVFNPADETLTEETGTTLPISQWNSAAVLSKGDDIFLFGGLLGAGQSFKSIYHYNTQTKQFTLLPQTLTNSFSEAVSWTIKDTNVYMLAGSNLQIGSLSEYVVYKTIANKNDLSNLATKDDLENLGITVIEKTLSGSGENTTIANFTLEEVDKILNDKSAIVVGTYEGTSQSLIFTQQEQIEDGSANLIAVSFVSYYADGNYHIQLMVGKVAEQPMAQIRVIEDTSGTEIQSITISAPTTATQGTITSDELATLQENDQNYIIFNDEIFRLNDKQHESGYLVYSHNGHDTTGCFFQKCITITVSTLGWVLESQENASKTYVDEQITSAYGYNVRVDGETLVFETVGNALQGDY